MKLMRLLYDCELRRFDFKWFPFARATVRIRGRHAVAHDSERGIVRHNPLQHPELAFRLLFSLTIAHRKVDDFPGILQVNNQLGSAISLSRCGIDRGHTESDGFT